MPFFDRFWWLRYAAIPGALAVLGFGVAATYRVVEIGQSSTDQFMRVTAIISLLTVFPLLLYVLWQAIKSVKEAPAAHERFQRWRAAMWGEQDVIPLARSSTNRVALMEHGTPLKLLVVASKKHKRLAILVFGGMSPIFLLFALISQAMMIVLFRMLKPSALTWDALIVDAAFLGGDYLHRMSLLDNEWRLFPYHADNWLPERD